MTDIVTTDVSNGQVTDASVMNNNFTAVKTVVNGELDSSNLSATAAIAASQLAAYPADATKFLAGDGTWLAPSVATSSALGTFGAKNNPALAPITLNTVSFDTIGSCLSGVNAYSTLVAAGIYLISVYALLSGQTGDGVGVLTVIRQNSSAVDQETLGSGYVLVANAPIGTVTSLVNASANDRITINTQNGATGSAGSVSGRISILRLT